MSSEGGNRWFADSSLEESGFEPSVPQKTPGGVVVLVRFAPTFPVAGIKQRRYERLSKPRSYHAVPTVRIRFLQR